MSFIGHSRKQPVWTNFQVMDKNISLLRYFVIAASIFAIVGCTSRTNQKWLFHLPDPINPKVLNAAGKQQYYKCTDLLRAEKSADDYCLLWAYQTTDLDNGDNIFPSSLSFWDYLEAINLGEYVPYLKQVAKVEPNNSEVPSKKSNTSNSPKPNVTTTSSKAPPKVTTASSKARQKVTTVSSGPTPKTASTYEVVDNMSEHDSEIINTSTRVQVTIKLPGEK